MAAPWTMRSRSSIADALFDDALFRYSIVIPTYGRAPILRKCLEGCAALDYPAHAFEVIIVDDGDHEATRDVVADFARTLRVTYLPQRSRQGPAAARNAGADVASGHFIAFIDDDCVPDRGWLTGFDAVFGREHEPVLVGGCTHNSMGDNIYAAASQNLVEFLYEWYNANPSDARFFASNNLAAPRSAFLELGGFDESFPRAAAEDRDFCDRWRECGWRLIYAPQGVISHRHRLSLLSFVRQHVGYGMGAVHLHEGRDRRQVSRPKLEPQRFYWRLVSYPLRQGLNARSAALVALACISQASYAAGYYGERLRHERARATRRRPVHTPVGVRQPAEAAEQIAGRS